MKKSLGIYIHVPFCNGKCHYCNFISGLYSDQIKREYFLALENEINSFDFNDYIIDTIYFGGGTPSSIDEKYILKILEVISNKSIIDKNSEITIECNPESFSKQKAIAYNSVGINRISFGLQTSNDKILKNIGRLHTKKDFIKSLDTASLYFNNISTDIMIGLPYQTIIDVNDSINFLLNYNVKHISAYGLKVEKGTKLYNSGYVVDDDYSAELYDFTNITLKKNGYNRYEVSNFAKNGYESRHNQKYWSRDEYVGFGLSAHSFINNTRKENTSNIYDYINGITSITSHYIPAKSTEALEEFIFLSLRTQKGINLDKLKSIFNYDLLKEKQKEINYLNNFINVKNNYLFLNDSAFFVMNEIIIRLIP